MSQILIVEDEPEISKVLEMYLRGAGYDTERSEDGDQAVDYFNRLNPDLVLLDINLPKRDGIDVLKHIRTKSMTPVIMLTARSEELDELLGLETLPERAFIKADRQRLTQVLDNLLGNALRFTPKDGKIELRLGRNADAYAITVKDSGQGVPESDIGDVFERFYRGKTKQSGSGLGLSIAQSLVKLHGGSISVRNAREGGAEFEIRLPRSQV